MDRAELQRHNRRLGFLLLSGLLFLYAIAIAGAVFLN